MNNETLLHIVSASVSPAVMISGTAMLVMAFLNRQGLLTGRLRELHNSALHYAELGQREKKVYYTDRAHIAMHQAKAVYSRAYNVKWTLVYLFGGIIAFVSTSIGLGIGVFWPQAIAWATIAFVLGVSSVLVATLFAMVGALKSLSPLKREEQETDRLLKEIAGITAESTAKNAEQ
jgi:hypothetical protein